MAAYVAERVQSIASKHTQEEVLQQYFGYMYFVQEALCEALQTPLYYTFVILIVKIDLFFTRVKMG